MKKNKQEILHEIPNIIFFTNPQKNQEYVQSINDMIDALSDLEAAQKDGYDTFFNANVVVKIIKSKYTKELEEEIKKAFE